jgi:hypothetical protein
MHAVRRFAETVKHRLLSGSRAEFVNRSVAVCTAAARCAEEVLMLGNDNRRGFRVCAVAFGIPAEAVDDAKIAVCA